MQIKGFRKGKVPVPHLKKLYGRSLMVEVLQQTVDETSRKAIDERNERPASSQESSWPRTRGDRAHRHGQADLSYTMTFEVLPPIPVADLKR